MMQKIRLERRIIILLAAVLGMIGYIYLTPPVSQSSLLSMLGIHTRLNSDTEMYVQRFGLAFILLGVLPALAARICGFGLRDLGFRKPELPFTPVWLAGAVAVGAVIGLAGARSPALAGYYPYDAALLERVDRSGVWPFIAHGTAYFLFYYIPWELLFRGVLIFPLLDVPIERSTAGGRTLFLACIQVIPSSLLHFGHPAVETFGAVFFGFFAAWATVKAKSVIPVLLLHAAAGIFLDLAIVLGAG